MTSRKLRIGVIGIGGVARGIHLKSWQAVEEAELVAFADIIPERARAGAEIYGVEQVYDNHRDLLKVKDIDAVDICTPNCTHAPIACDALAAGKHVLCEKPLAPTPPEVESMIAAAAKANRKLCGIQNQRFRAISQAVRSYIDEGHLGTPYYARVWAIRRNLLPPSPGFISKANSGGGPCMDFGVHCLDLAMWLMNFPEPVTVSGSTSDRLARSGLMPSEWGPWDRELFDVEDFACGMVRFADGAMMTLESSWLLHAAEKENMSCTIFGEKAGINWPHGVLSTVANGALVDGVVKPLNQHDEGHLNEIRAFCRSVIDDTPVPVPAEQSLKVIRILDGVYRSQAAGEEVRV